MARPLSPTTKFILSLPNNLPVAQVVEKAKAAGFPTSTGNVYQVRRVHAGKAGQGGGAAKPPKAPTPKAAAGEAAPTPSKDAEPRKSGGAGMTKAEYVRSLGPQLMPTEIMKLAARDGVKLTLAYVYNLRKLAKKKGTKGATAKAAPHVTTKRGPGRPSGAAKSAPKAAPAASKAGPSGDDAAFRAAVAAHVVKYGLIAAQAIVEDVSARIRAAGES